MICASKMGADTVRMGSEGKTIVPSGTAVRSPVKRKDFSLSRKFSGKMPSDLR